MTIAVDFDGTIVEHKYPAIGPEIHGSIAALRRLSASHKLILWTVREGALLEEAVQYCRDRGLEFYAVNSDGPGYAWGENRSRKVRADLFIDDANLGGIPDWTVIEKMVNEHLTYGDVLQGEEYGYNLHHKKKKAGPLKRLIYRCRDARARMNGDYSYSSSGHRHGRHHW